MPPDGVDESWHLPLEGYEELSDRARRVRIPRHYHLHALEHNAGMEIEKVAEKLVGVDRFHIELLERASREVLEVRRDYQARSGPNGCR